MKESGMDTNFLVSVNEKENANTKQERLVRVA